MTLIELMTSLFVFALISSSVLAMLYGALSITRQSRSRVAAANLAAREIEIVRGQFSSSAAGPKTITTGQVVNGNPLPGGTRGLPLVVDGASYTVTRVAQWQSQADTASPCNGGASGQLAYLRVTVTVTWPRMRSVRPVTSSTLLTPKLGTYASGTGHIKAKVIDRDGVPLAGQTVSVSGITSASLQTESDGCAFFAYLSPGNYTVSMSTTGYVDPAWNPTPSVPVTVTANTVQPVGFSYAPAANLDLSFASPVAGFPAPTTAALTVYNVGLPSSTHTTAVPGGGARRTVTLWPYQDGATVWAGDCLDADPQAVGGVRPMPLATSPGETTAAAVSGTAVEVNVRRAAGGPVAGATLVAVHAADNGCPGPVTDPVDGGAAGEVLTLPFTTDTGGITRVLLPYGAWSVKVIGQRPNATWPTATFSPSTNPVQVAVTVR